MVRAKFTVSEVVINEDGSGNVKLSAVIAGSKENEMFFNYTPYGEINMGTINRDALTQFKKGDEFYVDFTKAE